MPRKVEFLAREIARRAGYDPDQLVVEIDGDRDFDFLVLCLAPVDILKIKPMYTKFLDEAQRRIQNPKLAEERSYSAFTSTQKS